MVFDSFLSERYEPQLETSIGMWNWLSTCHVMWTPARSKQNVILYHSFFVNNINTSSSYPLNKKLNRWNRINIYHGCGTPSWFKRRSWCCNTHRYDPPWEECFTPKWYYCRSGSRSEGLRILAQNLQLIKNRINNIRISFL